MIGPMPEYMKSEHYIRGEGRISEDAPDEIKIEFEKVNNSDTDKFYNKREHIEMVNPYEMWNGEIVDIGENEDLWKSGSVDLEKRKPLIMIPYAEFIGSDYFRDKPHWYLLDNAPDELKRIFEEFMNSSEKNIKGKFPEMENPFYRYDGVIIEKDSKE